MKILIISSFPAPYRVDVFKELSKKFELDLFFETNQDQNRNSEWFAKKNDFVFDILDNEISINKFKVALSNIELYDAVLAYDFYLKSAIKAQLRCIVYKVPYFINCDGAFINRNPIKKIVKKFLVSNASGCFASGQFAKLYFLYFGANEKNIYMHNFTSLHKEDILEAPVSSKEKSSIRAELKIENKKTVLTVGQFVHRKGFDILLEAWEKINSDYQLIIIGGGELEASYKKIIESNNLKNVKLIGFQPKNIIFKYYKASDLFVLPTREDIWGLVIDEAMACGVPIITTDRCIAGMELIEDGVNGYIVPVENILVLKEKIVEILQNDYVHKKMSSNNIKKIQGNTIESIANCHIDIIKKFFTNRV